MNGMASTDTDADPTTADATTKDEPDPGWWPVTAMYLLVSLAVGAWAVWRWFNGGAGGILSYTTEDDPRGALVAGQLTFLLEAMMVLASQLVFLVPVLRLRLHRPAVTTVAVLAGILAVLELLVTGYLGIVVGGIMWSGEGSPPIIRPIAGTFAWAAPPVVLTAGAIALRLGIADPPRSRTSGAVIITLLVGLSFTMVLAAAWF
ncbi:hypothetical protein JNB63_17475 [Microbacterium trichothecenolyticum]|uniref:hypothetical protein n=1 Tax=Microbacterium trichothecenolyticum TaxID=69370 RepID=UPI001C6F1B2A|nr:hypothetical protein [Microbacterium trichothecenolyticum]MBW9121891.1 hypothetical protein [Microbacterium trichothecenolyticum]